MNKVITIHLHGKAYQVEEQGFARLRAYLDDAARRLDKDPDKEEIISDLEQAIAEKLERLLTPSKTVVAEKEVDEVIKEMGPVESAGEDGGAAGGDERAKPSAAAPRRMYQVREGAMIAGVCTGVAAYFDVDVTLVRIIFVALALLTHGVWIAVYVIMMIILPHANTSAEKAAAFGQPFTAQDWVNRARVEYAKYADKHEWKKWKQEWKEKRKQMRMEYRQNYSVPHRGAFMAPLFGLISALLALLWVVGLITIIAKGAIFGLVIPASIPLWAAIVIWLFVYNFVTWPIKAAMWGPWTKQYGGGYHYGHGFFDSIIGLAVIVLAVWAVWHYVPAAHPFLEQVRDWCNHIVASIRAR